MFSAASRGGTSLHGAFDDDRQFAFVVHGMRVGGQLNGDVGPDDRGVGLDEDHRILRRSPPISAGVGGVVLAHADDLARQDRRAAAARRPAASCGR